MGRALKEERVQKRKAFRWRGVRRGGFQRGMYQQGEGFREGGGCQQVRVLVCFYFDGDRFQVVIGFGQYGFFVGQYLFFGREVLDGDSDRYVFLYFVGFQYYYFLVFQSQDVGGDYGEFVRVGYGGGVVVLGNRYFSLSELALFSGFCSVFGFGGF